MRSRLLSLPELIARLQGIEAQLAELAAVTPTPDTERGRFAHQAQLLRKKSWYLGRIRALKPVHPLGACVHDDIHTGEGLR